jgi:lysozyme
MMTRAEFEALAVQVAAALMRRFEGLYLLPYLCPAGIPSIGYGATYYQDGTRVTLKDPAITREIAEALLLWMVRTIYLPAVLKLCPGVDSPERLAALIDFAFNLGTGRLAASTLRRRVNANRWADVPAEFRKWVRGGGRVLRGLVLRREAEIALLGRTA